MGFSDMGDEHIGSNCPCSKFPGALPPSFVHDNYYCQSGAMLRGSGVETENLVWDGEGCSNDNSCCSDPNLPWFYRQLPLTTSKDIEARICCDQSCVDEEILVKELHLYVQ